MEKGRGGDGVKMRMGDKETRRGRELENPKHRTMNPELKIVNLKS
jgi:hypothetical protein